MKKPAASGQRAAAAKKTQAAAHQHHGAAKAKHPAHPAAQAARSAKSHAAAKKKQAAAAHKPRRWTPDGDVALCSARAVAESLRIALGVTVADDDVLGLYWATAGDADAGASIWATLQAAQAWGGAAGPAYNLLDALTCGNGKPFTHYRRSGAGPQSVLLGLELPAGPHAVLDDGRFWWSWGQPYNPADFPSAVIEEAWAVTWA